MVPANKFEIIECQAALEAVKDRDLDGEPVNSGSLDVLCQHILLVACAGAICPDQLFKEIKKIGAYEKLTQSDFNECLRFCMDGGYALNRYEQWHRLKIDDGGNIVLRDPRAVSYTNMTLPTILLV